MTGRRGRPPKVKRRGRPPKYPRDDSPERITTEDDFVEEEDEEEIPVQIVAPPTVKRRRGRPSTKTPNVEDDAGGTPMDIDDNQNAMVSRTIMRKLSKDLPRLDTDQELVICAECQQSMTYRQFRLHNIQCHMNTAPTVEEKGELVMDHKYFSRKLNEFKKLTKMTMFECPKQGCSSSFKSTLGLAYHMNTCGRTKEELDAVLLECEICHMKFTLPNLAWHKKTHEEKEIDSDATSDSDDRQSLCSSKGNKRRSALIARKSFKRAVGKKNKDDDEDWEEDDDDEEVADPLSETPKDSTSEKKSKAKKRGLNDKEKEAGELESNDFNVLALEFLESLDETGNNVWNDPPRFVEDPFLHLNISDNSLQLPQEDLEQYLPDHRTSVEFKCIVDEDNAGSSSYHRLNWFEGETVEINSHPVRKTRSSLSASVHHTGGPVLSMAWHPSGKFLAVSVGHSYQEDLDSLVTQHRKSCVQLYRRWGSTLNLHLVLGVEWGYATHIQWSSFCPDIMESYNPSVESCFDDLEIYARLGYLAMLGEDSTVRIVSLGIQDLKVPSNYEYKPPYKIKVYRKTPEIELRINPTTREDDDAPGNAVKFDWHEQNKYMAVGYADGYVAVFDLQTSSPLLVEREGDTVVINPFWMFQGHKLGVRGIVFDPMDSRILVTASQDRQMKVWDLFTRTERDNKKSGVCLDMCWVRGWIHQVASFENLVAYQSAMHNYVRIFQTGSPMGKPSSAELFNVTSLDFYHGLTVQSTEDGKVNCTYYDWFWRECDYERNRRKKNLAVLSSVEVDKESYEKFSAECFAVTVKRLKSKVVNSKLYQRLAINEEEGVYDIALRAKFGKMNIYDELPNTDEEEENEENERNDEEEEDEENQEDEISTTLTDQKLFNDGKLPGEDEYSDLTVNEAINSAMIKVKDGLLPIYDVTLPETEPRLNFTLSRKRPGAGVPVEGLEPNQVEEYIRFHHFIRINKVKYSPSGDVIAVGYRNGLITLLPGNFDSIFPS